MNVLQIVPELNAGGVERTTLEMAEALSKAGHTPHVASAGGRLETELAELGGVLHKFHVGSKNPLSLRRNTKALTEIIKGCNIDIVHARSRAPAWPAHGAAKATNTPFLTTYHGIYNARGRMKRRYNAIMAKGDIVIANSQYTKAHIMREHGTSANKITVIPRGVDMKLFDLAQLNRAEIETQFQTWNVPLEKIIILLPGRLTRWKGQLVAIEALSKLSDEHVLVCLGDAQGRKDYVQELKQKSDTLGVSDRVYFPGHCSNMPAAFACADVVISASTDPEAFGRVAAEAQAMQRPIIASAHGGSLETVKNGETGILVGPADPDALAAGIKRAIAWDDYDGDAARAHIMENFSKVHLQRSTLAVYGQLMLQAGHNAG
jgi:glycosyltransferase involved in cell wall biosynthesis